MIINALTILAAGAVVVQCICALNHMTIKTRNRVRIAYLALLLSAASAGLAPLYEAEPSFGDAALMLAVAGFVFINQRRTYLISPSASSST